MAQARRHEPVAKGMKRSVFPETDGDFLAKLLHSVGIAVTIAVVIVVVAAAVYLHVGHATDDLAQQDECVAEGRSRGGPGLLFGDGAWDNL